METAKKYTLTKKEPLKNKMESAKKDLRDIREIRYHVEGDRSPAVSTIELGENILKKPNSNKEVIILLVDDNSSNLFVLQAMLSKLKIKCDKAFNGLEAVEMVSQLGLSNYKLILMDINMPIMNGIDATRKIKELEVLGMIPEIPVIAVSAQEEEKVKQQAIEAGVADYIEKPISLSKIERIIKLYC